MKKLLLLSVLLLQSIRATAQDDVIFTRYSHYDGLPSVFNNTQLFVDRAGFLWIYSEQGFTRYDGYNFKSYPFNNAARWGKTIPTGFVPQFPGGFERFNFSVDLDVYVYNPLKNGFDRYDFSKFTSEDPHQVLRILDDTKNHCLWISSKKNLFRLKYFTGESKKYSAPTPTRFGYLLPRNEIIYSSHGDSITIFNIDSEKFRRQYLEEGKGINNYLFAENYSANVNGEKGDLISKVILSDDMKTVYWFNKESSPKVIHRTTPMGDVLAERFVMTLVDPYNVWLSMGPQLLHIDFRTGQMDSIDVRMGDNVQRSYHTTGMLKDQDNELWVSYVNHGVVRVNTTTKKVTDYLSVADNPNSLWSNDIASLTYHSSGVVWAAQNSYRLVKIEKQRNIFSTINPVANKASVLSDYFNATNTRMCFPFDNDHVLAGTFTSLSNINIKTGKVA